MRFILFAIACIYTCSLSAQQPLVHTVYFDFAKAEASQSSQQKLDAFIAVLKIQKVKNITVIGHTDKAGEDDFNMELSNKRAKYVQQYLTENLDQPIATTIEYFGKDSLITIDDAQQSLNRRVSIIAFLMPAETVKTVPEKNKLVIEPYFEDVKEQHFIIDLDDTVFVQGEKGTSVKISPGSLQTLKGQLMKGQAEMIMKEYYDASDIILAGLTTVSPQGILQTGGMFTLTITNNTDTMSRITLKPVEIRMPKNDMDNAPMNVFTMSHAADSARWQNTGNAFALLGSYWAWPISKKWDKYFKHDAKYENWAVKTAENASYRTQGFSLNPFRTKFPVKRIKTKIVKKDANTLLVDLHVDYRNKGEREFNMKSFDTSFKVDYYKAQYQGFASSLSYINCDRFMNGGNTTEFYVTTPDCDGATIIIYIKRLQAYIPAYSSRGKFGLPNIPINEPVTVIAFGKKGSNFYFGRKDYLVEKKGNVELKIESSSEEIFKEKMKKL